MGYLLVCIAAAAAMAISVYTASASLLLAFAAYSLTGTVVLLTILLTDAQGANAKDEVNAIK